MSIQFNPAEIYRTVWAMKNGKIIAIPAVILLAIVLLATFLVFAHLGIQQANSQGLHSIAIVLDQSWFGTVALTVIVTTFLLWLVMFFMAGQKKVQDSTRISIEKLIVNPNLALGVYTGDGMPE